METRKGIKTSEFWVGIATSALAIVNAFSEALWGVSLPADAILSIVGVAATYILGRSVAKHNVPADKE